MHIALKVFPLFQKGFSMDSELVHTAEATAANVHDCEQNCTRKSESVTKVCAVPAQALQSRDQHQAANIAHNAGLSS